MEDAVEVFPEEEQADDVVPTLDDVLVVIDGEQVAAAEREDRFQNIAIFCAEAQAGAIGQFAAFAKMELADFVGGKLFAPIEGHVEQRSDPGQQQQPTKRRCGARIELWLKAGEIFDYRRQYKNILE